MQVKITQQLIRRALVGIATPSDEALDSYVAAFDMWAYHFGIDGNTRRVAMFLAQTIFESAYLKSTEENLNYSADGLLKVFPKYFKSRTEAEAYARNPQRIANRVYANRMGNGDESSGDGWKYRGRGYIMLTGKQNFKAFNEYNLCTVDVVADPDILAKVIPTGKKDDRWYLGMVATMWFWEKNKLNDIADTEDVAKVTKIINGGSNGLSNRQLLYRRFAKEFGIKKI